MQRVETPHYSEIVDINGNPFILGDPMYEDIFQRVPITRRELFTMAFATATIFSGIAGEIGADMFIQRNRAIETILHARNIECRADQLLVQFTREELMRLWQAMIGDSIGRGHADKEMKNEDDVLPPGDIIADTLGLLFSPRSIAKIHLFESGEYDMHNHIGHAATLTDEKLEVLQYAFETRQIGTINLAHNQTPIEIIPYQLGTLEETGFFSYTQTRVIHQSAGGNDPNLLFKDKKFATIANDVVKGKINLWSLGDALSVFNEIDETLDPVAKQQYLDLIEMKRLHETAGNIKAVYIYGNVKLGSSAGLVTTRYLGENKGYEILVPKDPRVRQIANIYSMVIQNKKKEGINAFLNKFPDPGFTVSFVDLYELFGDGFLGDKRLFLYEHPTKLGYITAANHILSRMRIDGKTVEEFTADNERE